MITQPSLAEDPFHITFEQSDISSVDGIVSGLVVFNIVNASGGDVTNLVASVDGPNHITYGSQPVVVPALGAGEAAQFVEQFSTPGEPAAPEAEAVLKVEYLDAAGEPQTVYVNGTLVQ
jgi:hypothetical protein